MAKLRKLKRAVRAVLPTAVVSAAERHDAFVVRFSVLHFTLEVQVDHETVDAHTVASLTRHIKQQFGLA